jgi:hypothetical protein
MGVHPSGEPRQAHPAAPYRRDLVTVGLALLALGLVASAFPWLGAQGLFSGPGAGGGALLGLLLVVASNAQAKPQFAVARALTIGCVAAGLGIAGALWAGGPAVRWTGLVAAGVMWALWLLIAAAGTASVNRARESATVTVGSGAAGRALVVYHSARGGLMRTLQEALADGMQRAGWRVDLSTASERSPVDLGAYQLLILGSPCYYGGPAHPISAYLDRLGDLRGLPVVIVVSGFDTTDAAVATLHQRVEQAHGTVLDEIELWTARPNRERDGTTDPVEIMRRAGARLARVLQATAA